MPDRQDLVARLRLVSQSLSGFEQDTVNEAIEAVEALDLREYQERLEAMQPDHNKPVVSSHGMSKAEMWEFCRNMISGHKAYVVAYISDKGGYVRYSYSGSLWDRLYLANLLHSLMLAALSKLVTKPAHISENVIYRVHRHFETFLATVIATLPVFPEERDEEIISGDTGKHLHHTHETE